MKEKVSTENLDAAIRFCVGDKNGRALLKWFLQQCDVEARVPLDDGNHVNTVWVESRRALGRELRQAIARNFDRHKIVDIEDERHG